MRGSEILKAIDLRQQPGHEFIRWWRRENDFADYELLDDFRSRVDGTQEFEGFELLDIDAMWRDLVRLSPSRLSRHNRSHGAVIVWEHKDAQGALKEDVVPFSPRALMSIFDVETKGDTLV